jgi:hypothetical protein
LEFGFTAERGFSEVDITAEIGMVEAGIIAERGSYEVGMTSKRVSFKFDGLFEQEVAEIYIVFELRFRYCNRRGYRFAFTGSFSFFPGIGFGQHFPCLGPGRLLS